MSNDRKTSNNQKSGLRLFMLLCVFIALIGAGIVKAIEANAESIAPANVEYYVLIDNEWTRIATDEVNDMRGFGNKSRYYTTASHLKEIYKNYGFDASIYNGEMIFPHTDYMDPNTIWADTAPELEDNTWKIPLSHRTRSYVYYLPNNVKGNNPYYTTSVSKEDETLKSTNTFYTVSVSDPRRTLTNLPETQYILTGHSVSLTLPILSQGNWLAYNCDTDEVIEPDDYITSKNEMKITFDHVTSPIKVVTSTLENPEYTLRFNTNTVNGCLTQIGEIAASQQQVEETMTILGNTSYEDVYESDREDVYTVFEPDSKRCLVSIKGSSKMKKYYYVFQGWC
ncbi:MAG: hypothetical protein Q4Q31_10725 [Bacillota bacterium]|nr:hypothetical protein [Bacillota bacterium]